MQTKTKNKWQQKKLATHKYLAVFLQPITISSEIAGTSRMVPGPIRSESSYDINKLERAREAYELVERRDPIESDYSYDVNKLKRAREACELVEQRDLIESEYSYDVTITAHTNERKTCT